jgi:hypothetical protein
LHWSLGTLQCNKTSADGHGKWLGATDGVVVGCDVDGEAVGIDIVGFCVGFDVVGLEVGFDAVGRFVGVDVVGLFVGALDGFGVVGLLVGCCDVGFNVVGCLLVGAFVFLVGSGVGEFDGLNVGLRVGACDVGFDVGDLVVGWKVVGGVGATVSAGGCVGAMVGRPV